MNALAMRLLALLETRKHEFAEMDKRIDKYQHSLQCAARARAHGESDDYVLMALFHDVFGGFHPLHHGNMAGVTLQPYLHEEALMACYEHPYAVEAILRNDKPTRTALASAAYRFANAYDLPSFDPHYYTPPVEAFYPLIEKVMK